MEALDAFGINWKLLVIQGVNFGIVLLILYRFLYRPLFAVLERRQNTIAKGLEDARIAVLERAKMNEEKEKTIRDAREIGGHIVEELRKNAHAEEKEILRNAQEKSSAILGEARSRGEEEREHLVREAEKEVARMAVLAAEKILRTK